MNQTERPVYVCGELIGYDVRVAAEYKIVQDFMGREIRVGTERGGSFFVPISPMKEKS